MTNSIISVIIFSNAIIENKSLNLYLKLILLQVFYTKVIYVIFFELTVKNKNIKAWYMQKRKIGN